MTMSSKEKNTVAGCEIEWNAEEEIKLFLALEGLKPVGLNKHFHMACIAERLSKSLNREIPAEVIWEHLGTMYNLSMLDEMEPLPFPNEQKDFCLPDNEFRFLMSRKQLESEKNDDKPDPKDKSSILNKSLPQQQQQKDLEKKVIAKLQDIPKRSTQKRTRGSVSLESPSTTPPPTAMPNNKRRRI